MPKPKPKTDAKKKIAAIGNKHVMPVIDSDEPSWTRVVSGQPLIVPGGTQSQRK